MARNRGNRGKSGTGNRGRTTYGRRFPVIGAKKAKPGGQRKARRALTTAGAFPAGYAMPGPVEPEAEEVFDDVDDVTPEQEERANEARESESEQ